MRVTITGNGYRIYLKLYDHIPPKCTMVSNKGAVSDIEQKYEEWQGVYHDFMQMCDQYFQLLSREEYMQYACSEFELRDIFLRNFKRSMSDWFAAI